MELQRTSNASGDISSHRQVRLSCLGIFGPTHASPNPIAALYIVPLLKSVFWQPLFFFLASIWLFFNASIALRGRMIKNASLLAHITVLVLLVTTSSLGESLVELDRRFLAGSRFVFKSGQNF